MNVDKLIKQCQKGNRSAFDRLLNQHYDTIFAISFKWCQNQHDAQDIAQLACIKLANNIAQFRFESKFSTWLYRLVINAAKDYYKSPKQTQPPLINEISTAGSQQSTLEQHQYTQQILEHIGLLPVDLRDTLVLVFGNGLNHKQAATELNIKESTVSWRIHEARKLLKQTFESTTLNPNSVESLGGAV